MLLGFRITVLLGHAEVDHMDDILALAVRSANEEVVGLDVAVYEVLLVDCLDSRQHLLRDHYHGLDRKSSIAVVEEVLQARTKQVDNQYVVQAFLAEVVHIGYTS